MTDYYSIQFGVSQNVDSERSGPSLTETEVSSDCSVDSLGGGGLEVDSPPTKERCRNVSFGDLVELEYTVIKGDEKYETAYPMTLGRCVRKNSHNLDEYEEIRQPVRQKGEALRVKPDERKKIIKNSKKAHKRRNSIGNGEIQRMSATFQPAQNADFFSLFTSKSKDKPTEADQTRPKLRRQSSIGNGEISRRSAAAPPRSTFGSMLQSLGNKAAEAASPTKKDKTSPPPSPSSSGRPTLRRQTSIGNGEISRLSATTIPSSTFTKFLQSVSKKAKEAAAPKSNKVATNSDHSLPSSPTKTRPALRRQSSIGNGEIWRLSRPASKPTSTISKLMRPLSLGGSKSKNKASGNTVPSFEELQTEVAVTTGASNPAVLANK